MKAMDVKMLGMTMADLHAVRARLGWLARHDGFAVGLVLGLTLGARFLGDTTLRGGILLLIFVLLAQSMNLLTGMAGQLSLGHAGFFGVGAYASALTLGQGGMPLPVSLALAAAAAGACGLALALPAARLRPWHMAMLTLGFGLLFQEAVAELPELFGQPSVLRDIPSVAPAMLGRLGVLGHEIQPVDYFRILLLTTAGVMWLLANYFRGYRGRAMLALRADEMAAGCMGVARGQTKMTAYALSAAIAGLAGGFYAHLLGAFGPDHFGLLRSLEILAIGVVGGLGSMTGQVIAAGLFVGLGHIHLGVTSDQLMLIRLVLFGVALTLGPALLPRGLGGLVFGAARHTLPETIETSMRMRAVAIPRASFVDTSAALVISGVCLRFQDQVALDKVSFTLQPGHVTAVAGPEGAGKTTLLHVLSGVYRPDSGHGRFFGRSLLGKPDDAVAALGLRRTFQAPRLVDDLTVRENLLLGAHGRFHSPGIALALRLPGALREEAVLLAQVNAVLHLAGLADFTEEPAGNLPRGTRQLVEVARVLLADPRAVPLDEPATFLSGRELDDLSRLVLGMRKAGIIVLLTARDVAEMAGIVDTAVVLDGGSVVYNGAVHPVAATTAAAVAKTAGQAA